MIWRIKNNVWREKANEKSSENPDCDPDCVYEGKEPVIRESDAPVDVEAFITLLRKNRDENGGYIYVDTGERGVEINE